MQTSTLRIRPIWIKFKLQVHVLPSPQISQKSHIIGMQMRIRFDQTNLRTWVPLQGREGEGGNMEK